MRFFTIFFLLFIAFVINAQQTEEIAETTPKNKLIKVNVKQDDMVQNSDNKKPVRKRRNPFMSTPFGFASMSGKGAAMSLPFGTVVQDGDGGIISNGFGYTDDSGTSFLFV